VNVFSSEMKGSTRNRYSSAFRNIHPDLKALYDVYSNIFTVCNSALTWRMYSYVLVWVKYFYQCL
jgi:hypothetical protein